MPLPPAPAKRAALLSPEAYRQTATPDEAQDSTEIMAQPTPATARKRPASKAKPAASAVSGAASPAPASQPAKTPAPTPAPATQARGRPAPAQPTAEAPAAEASNVTPIRASATGTAARKRRATGPKKMFVLDTNVLLHDPTSLFRFEEHDIFLPMIVLEELDAHKKGMTEVARNGRQASRTLDAL
ncbi:MAG: PhoH family protein, partial [Proteobacteria bacterium]|nr:PhoH family protein [Pseudomonadota bacterium]